MAKNCKKQLSGAENRKKAKIKAIKTANVLSKVPKLNAYFNVKHAVNSTENTSSIDQKSIVDENSDDVLVNCSASAEQSRTNVSVDEVEKEKFETNLSSLSNDSICSFEKINTSFGFLFNITELSVLEVRQKAGELQKQYPQDLDTSFMNECIHFRGYLKGLPESVSTKSVLYLCQIMKDNNLLDIYPYVNIALRMFLCVPASNTSAERSFSTLKRVKSYLRSSMNDNRLNSLAILNIESQLTTSLNYDEIIEDFARSKARRKLLI